ncbi:hypothetical protein [Aeromicrobium sp. IC_218]|uniref:hypothetical protein n=1 Tax=Aeromicrobium sp. IC_218 TaxID=2545468 RepID=UPI001040D1B0|nr:hypothetical protein [Aeromicrobium sp. IC_218]TCI96360.1 hypothetical protein E0W78_14595 [Aeromicrobium sp. IC_218]
MTGRPRTRRKGIEGRRVVLFALPDAAAKFKVEAFARMLDVSAAIAGETLLDAIELDARGHVVGARSWGTQLRDQLEFFSVDLDLASRVARRNEAERLLNTDPSTDGFINFGCRLRPDVIAKVDTVRRVYGLKKGQTAALMIAAIQFSLDDGSFAGLDESIFGALAPSFDIPLPDQEALMTRSA